jgi:dipeptidyl aminopeptidase/acylaminoacyl peptidase
VDRAGGRLSWIEWDHPDMPWDHTRLMVGAIRESEGGIAVDDVRNIAGEIDGSICQPAYYGADLVFAADRDEVRDECDDYWNLYRWSGRELRRLTCDPMEYGAPHWVFGDACHAPLEHDTLLARRVAPHGEELVEINRVTGAHRRIDCRFDAFSQMAPGLEKDEVVLVAASAVESARMVRYRRGGIETIKALPDAIPAEEISRGAAISFPTRDGGMAHAFYYAPHNTRYAAPAGQRPPLLVTVHGGPTARASGSLDLLRQYWTGSGFAVLDVNHRGSTGYGRRFRQQLLGRWGRMDVDDVIDGIDHLVGLSLVDPARIFIRGKSAGGYVVLRALTEYPQYFRGGTCYYGIGNLSTLASITHKFEARYTDRLIGERYDPQAVAKRDSEYFQRSPINFIDRLRSPMILFQGLDDRVVPPQASREVAAALAERKIEHQYVEYPGEGHGFRKSETNIDAINKETAFYRRVMGLTC